METTACVELNPTKAFSHLSNGADSRAFRYMHIQMFPSVTLSLLPQIMAQPFRYIIVDYGVLNPNTLPSFSRCDCKFLIGNICPWKWKQYYETIYQIKNNHRNLYKNIYLLGTPGLKENLTNAHRNISNSIMPVPFIENPFQLTSTDFGFFEKLLEGK